MKKILVTFLSATLLSCGVQHFVENDNLENCGVSKIPKDYYFLEFYCRINNDERINSVFRRAYFGLSFFFESTTYIYFSAISK